VVLQLQHSDEGPYLVAFLQQVKPETSACRPNRPRQHTRKVVLQLHNEGAFVAILSASTVR